jgi:O-antigen/teichoic acid export membrane protein
MVEPSAEPPLPDATPAEIGEQVRRGAAWSLLNNVIIRAGSLVSGIVLARLLSPSDYGVYAIALVALTLLQSMNELGVSLAIVRWEGDVRAFGPTVLTIATASSVILYVVTFVTAPYYCQAMGSPHATVVLRLICISVILDGASSVAVGLLNRQFRQRSRLLVDGVTFLVSTGITIGLAADNYGPISFAWGRVIGYAISATSYLVLSPIKILPGWDADYARALIRFGLPLAGASLLVLAVSNVDNIVVGATLNKTALGLYLMAFNQSSWPLTVLSEAARRVTLAGFARLVDNLVAFRNALRKGMGLLMAVTVPVCVMLAAYSEPMLRFVYGDRWAPAATALRFLAILGLARVALFVGYDALVALGHARVLMAIQALWLGCLLPALVVGARTDGIRGASIAHVLVALLITVPVFGYVFHRYGVPVRDLLGACGRPAIGGTLIAVAAIGVLRVVHTPLLQLLVGGLVSLVLYLPIVQPMRNLLPGRRVPGTSTASATG